ncbi:MAG: ABC transporter permease [Nanoarchaeota archaeon]|nr:ABC transporter permease [Nanoarchaeota archaeon]
MIFLEILKKNFKLLLRSKTSALIVFLGPLILMLLISLAFNSSSLYDISIGTYSSSYSELSNSLIEKLEGDAYNVVKIDNEESCKNSVKDGTVHICAVFPPDMNIQTEGNIVFYVDESRMNLVWSIIGSISTKISTKSTELSTILTTKLMNALQKTEEIVSQEGNNIVSIKTKLVDIKNVVSEVESDLDIIEIANHSQLETELDEIKDRLNVSSSVFSDMEELIARISADITTTLAVKNSSTTSLKQVRLDLNTQIEDANKLKEAIDNIKKEVDAIEIKDVQKIVTPISTDIKPITSQGTHLKYSFPTLLLMVLLFAGIFLASTTVIEEKKSQAYFRNFITPTKDFTYIISDYIFCLLILTIQTIIIFGVMSIITKTVISATMLPNLVLGLLLASTAFIFLGMAIGYFFKDEETASIGSISIATIMLFFSNTILPIESLPTTVREIVKFNPFIIAETIIRRIYLFGETIKGVTTPVIFIAVYVVIFIILAFLGRKIAKSRIQ